MTIEADIPSSEDKKNRLTAVLPSELLKTLLDTISEAVTVVDVDGIVRYWNQAAERLYDIPAAEIVGHSISDFGWKSLMISRTLAEQTPIRLAFHEPKPGIYVLVNSTVLKHNDEIIGVISSEQDVTRLVRLGNELLSASDQLQTLEDEVTRYTANDDPFHRIKGSGVAISRAIETASRVAATDATILLTGESGVGKELFANAIHRASLRRQNRFVAINCGAIPSALFESELFGYQGGSFTGADRHGRQGKIELADGGTLFFDEIGELPLDMQVKLLRFLQERQFYRVGGSEPIHVSVRILAATNRDLEHLVAERKFREDLYYRLNVVQLELPPLRQRMEDIPELLQLFSRDVALQYGKPVPQFAPEVIVTLMNYGWPGNIRQLRNLVERLVILSDGSVIGRDHLPENLRTPWITEGETPAGELLSTPPVLRPLSEVEQLRSALQTTFGNKTAAAKLLGISRGTLYNKLKAYGLQD